jgi:P-type conjugative transfer protein TrbL
MLLLCLVLPWAMAQTAPDPANVVSSFLSQYREAHWPDTILNTTTYLFWSLATISAVWTFGMLLLRRVDIGDVLGELLRFIVVTGIFYWLLRQAGGKDGFVETIVISMRDLGGQLVGSTGGLQEPANAIANIGLSVFNTVVDQSVNWKDTDALVGFALVTFIVVVLALVAAQVALMLVGAWMLAYGGIFLLGFGGARWTSAIAISYYKHVLAVALSLLSLILLLSIGQDFLVALHAQMRGAVSLRALAVMLVLAILLLVLCVKVPGMLFNVVTGAQLGALTATASMAGHAIVVGGTAAWSSVRHASEPSTRSLNTVEKGAPSVDAVEACRKVSSALAEAQNDAVYRPLEYHQYGLGGDVPNEARTGSVFQTANQPPGGHVHTRDVDTQLKAGMQASGAQTYTAGDALSGTVHPSGAQAGNQAGMVGPGGHVTGPAQVSVAIAAGQAAAVSPSTDITRGQHGDYSQVGTSPISAATSGARGQHEQGGVTDAVRRAGSTEITSTTTGVQGDSRVSGSDRDRRDGGVNDAVRRNTGQEHQTSAGVASTPHTDGQQTRVQSSSHTSKESSKETGRETMVDASRASSASQTPAAHAAPSRESSGAHRVMPAGVTSDIASTSRSVAGGFRPEVPNARAASARKGTAARKDASKGERSRRDKDKVARPDKKDNKEKSKASTQKNGSTPSRLKDDKPTKVRPATSPDDEIAAFRDRDSGGSALFGEGGGDVA